MNVLIAFDKFKGSMSASTACRAAQQALSQRYATQLAPLTDGGEGFCEILTTVAGGTLTHHTVAGPRFKPCQAQLGIIDATSLSPELCHLLRLRPEGKLALIEMAQASGYERLTEKERDPWQTSTLGTGQLLAIATEQGASAVLMGIGGSATNDLGIGALEAVGLSLTDENDAPLSQSTPSQWTTGTAVNGEIWHTIPDIRIACDVSNPLIGPNGCTAIFAPQKGLKPHDFNRFEKAVGTMAKRLCAHFEKDRTLMATPGAGAAGGLGFGLMVACDAELVAGFPLVNLWLGLDKKLAQADTLITGEGKFDASSLCGKGPGTLVQQALAAGKTVHVFAGAFGEGLDTIRARYPEQLHLHAITPSDMPLAEALAQGEANLHRAVGQVL